MPALPGVAPLPLACVPSRNVGLSGTLATTYNPCVLYLGSMTRRLA